MQRVTALEEQEKRQKMYSCKSVISAKGRERYQIYVDPDIRKVEEAIPIVVQEVAKIKAKALEGVRYAIYVVDPDPVTKHQAIRLEWVGQGIRAIRKRMKQPINNHDGLSTVQPRGASLFTSAACTMHSERIWA